MINSAFTKNSEFFVEFKELLNFYGLEDCAIGLSAALEASSIPGDISIIIDLPNGASGVIKNGKWSYMKYNTGDQVWLSFINDKYVVTKCLTHDGLIWKEGMPALTRNEFPTFNAWECLD